jgi:shikimate kinase
MHRSKPQHDDEHTHTGDGHPLPDLLVSAVLEKLAGRPIVLIGMMGAGKTTVGRRLASALDRRFIDSDAEIETAANMTVSEFFETHGETDFRIGEARVIARLLGEDDIVLGTGGGAYMNARTRALIAERGVSIWLRADLDTLFERVSRRSTRPLLKTTDPRRTLKELMDERHPVYAGADMTVESRDVPHETIVSEILNALSDHLEPHRK